MTTMDSDSESQDSDDGRRFRFEATRKDTAPTMKIVTEHSKSKKSYSEKKSHRDRQVKYERGNDLRDRKTDRHRSSTFDDRNSSERQKELRHSKYSRHESRSSKRDDSKEVKEHRDTKNNAISEKETKRSDSFDSKDRSRDSKRYKDRSKQDHYKQRSQEKFRDKSLDDKHRSKAHVRYKHISKKDHERSYELSKRSTDEKLRNDKTRKSNKDFLKNLEDVSDSDFSSNINQSDKQTVQIDSFNSVEVQDCKDLDLSDFDVLSETDENLSDSVDHNTQNTSFIVSSKEDRITINEKLTKSSNNNLKELEENESEHINCKFSAIESSNQCRNNVIGPYLPSAFVNKLKRVSSLDGECTYESVKELQHNSSNDEDFSFGPALPPHLKKSAEPKVIGPALPNNVATDEHNENEVVKEMENEESENDESIGPLPVDHPAARSSYIHEQLEHRARMIKEGFKEPTVYEENKREEWMTELPPAQAVNLGLGPRKFRTRPGPDMSDRSSWTDTPADKIKKQKERAEKRFLQKEESTNHSKKRHKEESNKHRKREKSLLEMHQEALHKKKRKKEEEEGSIGKPIRRPFDRDIDLQSNIFDKAQKSKILKKAQMLDDRFARGGI
ncbi:protein starmaker-like [Prorops nasuta]|uniref:protein starmaker-like n=1 Tax=Prorops nasuta TaxID=863751 RepID=UPI0034CF2291